MVALHTHGGRHHGGRELANKPGDKTRSAIEEMKEGTRAHTKRQHLPRAIMGTRASTTTSVHTPASACVQNGIVRRISNVAKEHLLRRDIRHNLAKNVCMRRRIARERTRIGKCASAGIGGHWRLTAALREERTRPRCIAAVISGINNITRAWKNQACIVRAGVVRHA